MLCLFRAGTADGKAMISSIDGFDEQHQVEGIKMHGVWMNWEEIGFPDSKYLKLNKFVER